ncbi:MAG TPA: methyltransferase domain-containing protein, partial [Polyangiaceae bacterium]
MATRKSRRDTTLDERKPSNPEACAAASCHEIAAIPAKRKSRDRARDAIESPSPGLEITLETLGKAGDFGSLAHYADAAYYQLTYGRRRQDVTYYVRLARTCKDSSVLEYGCGNGRITIPMARAGASVTAVDLSKPMLNDFEARLTHEHSSVRARIKLNHADMRAFATDERFGLVIAPFNTLLHLYEPSECLEFLSHVRQHL